MDKSYVLPFTLSTSAMFATVLTTIASCLHCQCKTFTKNGKNNNKQCYQCKQCAYYFTIAKLQHGIDQQYVELCLKLYLVAP
jgi:transposase-like protein